jgi:ADP-ribose pyrophosphatase YjhB (NUDIX family)
VEHGEDPYDAVVREVAEETGYQVLVEQPLGVDSRPQRVGWEGPVVFQVIGSSASSTAYASLADS